MTTKIDKQVQSMTVLLKM